MGAPKKSKTGLVIGLIALAVVLCCCGVCGVGGYFARGFVGKAFGLIECSAAVEQQRGGLLAYANAHGGKLPAAGNWQDDIKPYVTKMPGLEGQKMISVPGPESSYCDKGGGTSITYNADLAGKKLTDVKDPYETPVLFETPGAGHNKAAPYKEQPFSTSPVLVKGQRRGWVVQPLKGEASFKDENGVQQAAPNLKGRRRSQSGGDFSAGPVDVIPSEESPAKKGKGPTSGE